MDSTEVRFLGPRSPDFVGNVGNAETNGFTTDVGISAESLNNAVSLFYITFVIFQPISAGIGKRVGPKYWCDLFF